MKRLLLAAVGCVFLTMLAGCQCCAVTECYSDVVDAVAYCPRDCSWLYCPQFDLSRIGEPDWCGPINCMLCRLACGRNCPACGGRCPPYPQYPNCPPPAAACPAPAAPLPPADWGQPTAPSETP